MSQHTATSADLRRLAMLAGLCLLLAAGTWWQLRSSPVATASAPAAGELQQRFDEAVALLQARQYEPAASALHRVLVLAPDMPEAHVNMGYALLGLQRVKEARDFFESATNLKPDQANAYYGLALAWEASGDLPMATGAMRTYLHLASNEQPQHLSRARAALWEWERAASAPAQ